MLVNDFVALLNQNLDEDQTRDYWTPWINQGLQSLSKSVHYTKVGTIVLQVNVSVYGMPTDFIEADYFQLGDGSQLDERDIDKVKSTLASVVPDTPTIYCLYGSSAGVRQIIVAPAPSVDFIAAYPNLELGYVSYLPQIDLSTTSLPVDDAYVTTLSKFSEAAYLKTDQESESEAIAAGREAGFKEGLLDIQADQAGRVGENYPQTKDVMPQRYRRYGGS